MDLRRLELPDESCRGVWCSASLLHLPRFKPGTATIAWFAFFAIQAVTSGSILIRQRARPFLKGAVA